MQTIPDSSVLRQGLSSSWVARQFESDAHADLLADLDVLFTRPECEVIKDQNKIKIGRVPVEIGGRLIQVYVKRYNAFSRRYRLLSLFRQSEACRSWRGAALLSQAGFNVGEPLAAVEHRAFGMLQKSFYLSAEIVGALTVDAFWECKANEIKGKELWRLQKRLIDELAHLFNSLHANSVYHRDLKDANILVQDEEARRYYFTDLDQVIALPRLSWRRKIKNLVQLNRTLGKKFSSGRRLTFLKEYLAQDYRDKTERRRWIRKILRQSRRADQRSLAKANRND